MQDVIQCVGKITAYTQGVDGRCFAGRVGAGGD